MKKDYELMNELMLSIFCTEAWERIEMHDPQIVKANERHDSVLQKIQNQLHHDDLVPTITLWLSEMLPYCMGCTWLIRSGFFPLTRQRLPRPSRIEKWWSHEYHYEDCGRSMRHKLKGTSDLSEHDERGSGSCLS